MRRIYTVIWSTNPPKAMELDEYHSRAQAERRYRGLLRVAQKWGVYLSIRLERSSKSGHRDVLLQHDDYAKEATK